MATNTKHCYCVYLFFKGTAEPFNGSVWFCVYFNAITSVLGSLIIVKRIGFCVWISAIHQRKYSPKNFGQSTIKRKVDFLVSFAVRFCLARVITQNWDSNS